MLVRSFHRSKLWWTRAASTFPQVNPKTSEVFAEYSAMTDAEVQGIISNTNAAFQQWRRVPAVERVAAISAVAAGLRDRADEAAELMCKEMGKPTVQGKAEVLKCAYLVDWYAEHGASFLKDEEHPALPGFQKSYVSCNGVLLKHAPNCFGSALLCEELFKALPGVPQDIFRSLVIDVPQVDAVLEHDAVQGVALTGSEGAGRAVAAKAGGLLKKAVIELGGSDAYAVLADADLDVAAEAIVNARVLNAGQVCIAPKRAIVDKSVKGAFEQKVLDKLAQKKYGVDFGPLVHAKARQDVAAQVEETAAAGAKVLAGGVGAPVPESDCGDAFFAPTVLTDVKPGMTAFDKEIFGPVISIIEAEDEQHAIALANFGGVKNSGLGRECSAFGMLEFINVKTICVK
eukprot:CAMPEP_0115445274 /NCGR_PEP_ID=MMETSP0271-20121206/38829_1 /TAXON_ID=71861 /ORGANISM="Scrippsiella trochoidea, Strain CCMP3099" /LENGTH=400 /DNA_ID=CAMNT_0002871235 /DNA_START=75 /DNA_END=1278 /DNA_ORIENTATION=-